MLTEILSTIFGSTSEALDKNMAKLNVPEHMPWCKRPIVAPCGCETMDISEKVNALLAHYDSERRGNLATISALNSTLGRVQAELKTQVVKTAQYSSAFKAIVVNQQSLLAKVLDENNKLQVQAAGIIDEAIEEIANYVKGEGYKDLANRIATGVPLAVDPSDLQPSEFTQANFEALAEAVHEFSEEMESNATKKEEKTSDDSKPAT